MKRVILEDGGTYIKGLKTLSDKEHIFGRGWSGTVVNIWDEPIIDIVISTTITSLGKDYPFSKHISRIKPDGKAKFDFHHTEDRWVESKNMDCGILKIKYNRK